jgi:hypothetical protein
MKNKFFLTLLFIFSLIFQYQYKENKNNLQEKNIYMNKRHTPIYALNLDATAIFQVFINDILVTSYYDIGATKVTLPINRNILSSGKQQVRILINSKNKLTKTELQYYKFKILEYSGLSSSEYKMVLDCNFDEKITQELFVYTQQWEFKAQVPYNFNGWLHSVDLSKEDPKYLIQEVINIYEDFRRLLQNKEVNKFMEKTQKRDIEVNQSLYLNDFEINTNKENTVNTINRISKVYPLENYKMVFYGNGRMVALIRIDEGSRDESALQAELDDESIQIYELLLHRPYPNAPLEVIR